MTLRLADYASYQAGLRLADLKTAGFGIVNFKVSHGMTRTHTATGEQPTVVVLVDEVALLTAYLPDRKLRDRAEKALALLATQGRAPGVVLVAALQDPRKEVVGLRNLFPTKIALRLDEKQQVDMVLGDGARE